MYLRRVLTTLSRWGRRYPTRYAQGLPRKLWASEGEPHEKLKGRERFEGEGGAEEGAPPLLLLLLLLSLARIPSFGEGDRSDKGLALLKLEMDPKDKLPPGGEEVTTRGEGELRMEKDEDADAMTAAALPLMLFCCCCWRR
jgi:hypothetical protein